MNITYPNLTDDEVKRIEDEAVQIARDLLGPGFVADYYSDAASGFIDQTCGELNAERSKAIVTREVPKSIGAPQGFESDSATNELVMIWYDRSGGDFGRVLEARVQPHEIVNDFLGQVTHHAMTVMQGVGERINRGDCPTCKNIGLIDAPAKRGRPRTERVYCPDCKPSRGKPAFAEFPRLGGGLTR